MEIKEITQGQKVAHRLSGSVLYIGDNDEIQIDLAERQKDIQVSIDVYLDDSGRLQEGSGRHYAANVIIPPRQHQDVEVQEDDMNGNLVTVIKKEALPLDVSAVTLQLWGIPEKITEITGGM